MWITSHCACHIVSTQYIITITIISFCQCNGKAAVIKAGLFYTAFTLLISLNALSNFLACKTATTQKYLNTIEDQNSIILLIS